MAPLPDIRVIFEDIDLRTVKRVIAGKPVRVVLLGNELFICARNYEELILVEPRIRKGGRLELAYALRDPALLAERLDVLKKPRKEAKTDYRSAQPRRLGRTGTRA